MRRVVRGQRPWHPTNIRRKVSGAPAAQVQGLVSGPFTPRPGQLTEPSKAQSSHRQKRNEAICLQEITVKTQKTTEWRDWRAMPGQPHEHLGTPAPAVSGAGSGHTGVLCYDLYIAGMTILYIKSFVI